MSVNVNSDCASPTIDPVGDVRLILDDGELRVSRKALCLSSAVFQAMLGDHSPFTEASQGVVDEEGIRTVSLKDDNFAAMVILMRVIHHQNHAVPLELSFTQLRDMAIICDKYALQSCILPWCRVWSQPYLTCVDKDGYESWLFISMVFQNEDAFTQVTKHLILNTTISNSGALALSNTLDLAEGVSSDIIDK